MNIVARLALVLAAAFLLAARPPVALAAPLLLDFEGLPAMTYLTFNPVPAEARLSTQFQDSHGVAFASEAPYVAVLNLGAAHATSGSNGIGGATAAGNLDYREDIELSFFVPGTAGAQDGLTDFVSVRGDLLGNDETMVTLWAYDATGTLIGSAAALDTGGIALTVALPGIRRAVISGAALPGGDDGGVGFDDLSFNPVTPVPEPDAVGAALAALGLSACGRRRIRSERA